MLFRRLSLIRLGVLKAQNDLIDVRESINLNGVPDEDGFVPAIDLHLQLKRAVELLDEAENYLRPEHYHTDQAVQALEVSHG
jgi:hypothetical protein